MVPVILLGLVLATRAAAGADLHDPVRAGELPQYVFFHLTTLCKESPDRLSAELLSAIPKTLGTPGGKRVRFGVAISLNVMEQPASELARVLERLFQSASAADVPVFICLDGQNWWGSRPDLWNWFDPDRPGYDPANRKNVEWFGWGPECAVKIGWRNWGRQIRVAPAPNLASPAVLAEHDKAFRALVPLIARWSRALPRRRKYLFGGFKVGWEASINVNAYYYRDGNAIFERSPKDASRDPNDHKSQNGWTFGQQPLGYNAAATSGIASSGELRKQDVETVIHNYLERLSRAVFELGIPRHMIFTHQGGTYAPWDQHYSFRPAINAYSIPGWSFYSHDPPECGSLASDMDSSGRRQWAAVEWLRKGATAEEWKLRFERALHFRQCRLVSVYNWEGVRNNAAFLAAVRRLAAAPGEK